MVVLPSPAPIEATPKAFFHSGIIAAATVTNRLVLRSADGSGFDVRNLEVDGVAVDLRPDPEGKDTGGKLHVIEFTVKAGVSAGIEHHAAKLTLSGGGAPLVVPVTLVVK